MSDAVRELDTLLRTRGVIASNYPVPPADTTDRPWFVALLQGAAGWLAGIFLLVFFGLVFKPQSGPVIFGLGALLLVAAWGLYHADRHGAFLDQLALAISMAGQIAVAISILEHHHSGLNISSTALLIQIFVLLVMPNNIARTLAAMFATIAWVYTVRFLVRPGDAERVFFGEESVSSYVHVDGWALPIAWLLTWLPLLALAGWLVLRESQWMASRLRRIARPLLTGLLSGVSIGAIAAEPFTMIFWGVENWGRGVDWLAIFPLLSIGLTLFAAYCAFRVRSNGLLGFAVLAALLHLSRFYYLYGTSLLWKSVIMLGVGAALLLAGVALRNRKPEVSEAP
jgi:hypothetical protein